MSQEDFVPKRLSLNTPTVLTTDTERPGPQDKGWGTVRTKTLSSACPPDSTSVPPPPSSTINAAADAPSPRQGLPRPPLSFPHVVDEHLRKHQSKESGIPMIEKLCTTGDNGEVDKELMLSKLLVGLHRRVTLLAGLQRRKSLLESKSRPLHQDQQESDPRGGGDGVSVGAEEGSGEGERRNG